MLTVRRKKDKNGNLVNNKFVLVASSAKGAVSELFWSDGTMYSLDPGKTATVSYYDIVTTIQYYAQRGSKAFKNVDLVNGELQFSGEGSVENHGKSIQGCGIKFVVQPSIVNKRGNVAPIGTNIKLDLYVVNGWGDRGKLTGFTDSYVELDCALKFPIENIRDFYILK